MKSEEVQSSGNPVYHMGAVEHRFADMIWRDEPVSSGKLVEKAYEELGWKKSTTYTVLRRLIDKGIFRNEGGTVTSRISRKTYKQQESREYVNESFGGSLPAFLAAFAYEGSISEKEAEELKKIIDDLRNRTRKEEE